MLTSHDLKKIIKEYLSWTDCGTNGNNYVCVIGDEITMKKLLESCLFRRLFFIEFFGGERRG